MLLLLLLVWTWVSPASRRSGGMMELVSEQLQAPHHVLQLGQGIKAGVLWLLGKTGVSLKHPRSCLNIWGHMREPTT